MVLVPAVQIDGIPSVFLLLLGWVGLLVRRDRCTNQFLDTDM